jgi:PAS domain S-box-containing protein
MSNEHERFRKMVENSQDWFWEFDENADFTYVSPRIRDLLGYEPEELIGLNAFALMDADEAERVHKHFDPIAKKYLPFNNLENINIHKDGHEVVIESSGTPIFNGEGQFRGYRGIDRDITERKQAEEALRESEARFRGIFELAGVGMATLSLEGKFLQVNPAFCKFLGYTEAELLDLKVEDVTHPEDQERTRRSYDEIVARQRLAFTYEKRYLNKDGSTIWGHVSVACVLGSVSQPSYCVGLVQDFTERKNAEEVLRESSRMKSEFIKTVAHEFRTPLTSIMGFSELLLTHDQLSSEEQRESLHYIHERSMALTDLVADIMDIARIDSGAALSLKVSPWPVTELFQQVQPFLKTQASLHRLEVNLDEETTLVNVDKGKIGQVLENLLSNAVKFSPEGSLVRIKGDLFQGGYRISVADQGVGMTPEQVAKVFDRFYRANGSDSAVEGAGMGMHIVKHIVEDHGGKVWVESEPGKGTTVRFTLPLTLRQVEENPNS